MRFEGFKLSKFVMYNGWLIGFGAMLFFMMIRPLSAGKGFMFFEMFHLFFLRDIRLTMLFTGILIWFQLEGFLISRTKPKFLEVLEDKTIFHLLNGKIYEFKYSELTSLERTNDIYKIFLFTFKDGKKQRISDKVENSNLAFEMIRERISKSQ